MGTTANAKDIELVDYLIFMKESGGEATPYKLQKKFGGRLDRYRELLEQWRIHKPYLFVGGDDVDPLEAHLQDTIKNVVDAARKSAKGEADKLVTLTEKKSETALNKKDLLIKSLQEKLARATEDRDQQAHQLALANKQLAKLEAKTETLENKLEKEQEKRHKATLELTEARSMQSSLAAEKKTLSQSFDSLQNNIKESARKIEASYTDQLNSKSADIATYRKLHEELTQENRAQASEITKLSLANADLANKLHNISSGAKTRPKKPKKKKTTK